MPQVVQTVETLQRTRAFGLIETFETLVRPWNIDGRSVRPDLRMIAHSGFITVARRLEKGDATAGPIPAVMSGEEGEAEAPVFDGG